MMRLVFTSMLGNLSRGKMRFRPHPVCENFKLTALLSLSLEKISKYVSDNSSNIRCKTRNIKCLGGGGGGAEPEVDMWE